MSTVLRAANVTEALALARQLASEGKYDLFRGQVTNWPVVSSLARLPESEQEAALERLNALLTWAETTPGMEPYCEQPDSLIAVAQHYGIPTNFVDFTDRPEVAAYFACDSKEEREGDACIVCLNSKDLLQFWADVTSVRKQPPGGDIEFLKPETPNLWRMAAQSGTFLYLPHANFEMIYYSMDRIVFPAHDADKHLLDLSDVYPTRKSDLERMLDQFFMIERMHSGDKANEAAPWYKSATHIVVRSVMVDHDVVRPTIEPHSSWEGVDEDRWLEGRLSPEAMTKSSADPVVLDCELLSRSNDFLAAALSSFTTLVSSNALDRAKPQSFLLEGLARSDGIAPRAPKARIEAGLVRTWDGMRRLPYHDLEIVGALGQYLTLNLAPGRPEELIPGPLEIEFGSDEGAYSRARVPSKWVGHAVRSDITENLFDESRSILLGNPANLLMAIRSPRLLFDFKAFARGFALWVIPSQEFDRRQDMARYYSPIRITKLGMG